MHTLSLFQNAIVTLSCIELVGGDVNDLLATKRRKGGGNSSGGAGMAAVRAKKKKKALALGKKRNNAKQNQASVLAVLVSTSVQVYTCTRVCVFVCGMNG